MNILRNRTCFAACSSEANHAAALVAVDAVRTRAAVDARVGCALVYIYTNEISPYTHITPGYSCNILEKLYSMIP